MWPVSLRYAGAMAMALANLIYGFSPKRVVLGGGVMQQPGIIERIRGEVQRTINGYLQSERITRNIDQLIVPPGLGTRSGVLGAMALAIAAE